MGWGICLVWVPGRRGQQALVAWGAALTGRPGPEETILPSPPRPSAVIQTVVGGCPLDTRAKGPGSGAHLSFRFSMKSSMVTWSKSTKSGLPHWGPSSSSILPVGRPRPGGPTDLPVQRVGGGSRPGPSTHSPRCRLPASSEVGSGFWPRGGAVPPLEAPPPQGL